MFACWRYSKMIVLFMWMISMYIDQMNVHVFMGVN